MAFKTKTPINYPHVSSIQDVPTQSSLRLVWDQLRNHNKQVEEMQATIDALSATLAAVGNTANSALQQTTITQLRVVQAQQAAGTNTPSEGGTNDDGKGAAGCASAGADGHVAADTPLTLETAGMIVCGTGNEFPALLAPAVDQPTRDANEAELLGRVIWHLQLAGFQAGGQRNPSGLVSGDKITVLVGTVWWAYDIFSINPFDEPFTMHMIPVGSPNTVADSGIPD